VTTGDGEAETAARFVGSADRAGDTDRLGSVLRLDDGDGFTVCVPEGVGLAVSAPEGLGVDGDDCFGVDTRLDSGVALALSTMRVAKAVAVTVPSDPDVLLPFLGDDDAAILAEGFADSISTLGALD
jgi:hypothetical protein